MRLVSCFLLSVLCQAQTDLGSVEGQAFNNATGEPVKKVQVLLRPVGSSSDPPYGALTDAGGRFAIPGVRPGRYILTAERAGFVRAEYGASGRNRRGSTVSVAVGQRLKDVEFRLTPQGVISGRVLDEDGDPVAGVNLTALRYGYVQGKRTLLPASAATTNDLGEYRLAGLAPSRYYLSANHRPMPVFTRSSAEDGYAPTYYPGTADVAGAAPIQVIAGNQMRGIDIGLTRVRTVRVSGRVTNPAATAATRNVMVFLMPREAGVRGFSSRNSTLAQEGKFEIRGVIPGSYTISAHWYEDGKRLTASQPVEVSAAGLDGVHLTMTPGFEVAGRVRVEGGTEPGLSGIQVMLVPANEVTFATSLGGRVNTEGKFVLSSVAPDQYRIQVAGLPEGCYLKAVRLGETGVLENSAVINPGAGPLEITISTAGGQAEGVVLDSGGQPAPGAVVVLVPDARRRGQSELYKIANTSQDGRFSLKGIPPGDYKLFAWQDVEQGAWQDPDFLKPFENAGESISIQENGRQAVQLKLLAAPES